MKLTDLNINNFKNITEAQLQFCSSINCLLGNNGMGKSNLLDAIYFLSFCRSFSGQSDKDLIKGDADFMAVQGTYNRNSLTEVVNIGMNRGKRKVLKRKGKEYTRLSEHIGVFPLVMVSPRDAFLITGSGEERRRLMDMIISQSDAAYLNDLIRYQHGIEQRNKLLRAGVRDKSLYEAIEYNLSRAALTVNKSRAEWLPGFNRLFSDYYHAVAGDDEQVALTRRTHMSTADHFQTLLDNARAHDQIVGYTSVGLHRDDIEIKINGLDARNTASQGQSKTITIAMRLAQFDYLKQATGITPLLLLDDIFDKLDARRVERIVDIVGQDTFGQIFITDTNREHLDNILRRNGNERTMWDVENGHFTPIKD